MAWYVWTKPRKLSLQALQICDVKAQLLDNPRIFDEANWSNAPEYRRQFYKLGIVSREKYFVLQASTETDIALLNTNVSDCFRALQNWDSVRYEGYLDVDAWRGQMQTWKHTGKAGITTIDINIYGSRKVFEVVGNVFSTARLYFQHPHHCQGIVKYENPHFLSLPNIPDTILDSHTAFVTPVRGIATQRQCDVFSVLENLHKHGYLREAVVDHRIKTELLRYVSLSSSSSFSSCSRFMTTLFPVIRERLLTT